MISNITITCYAGETLSDVPITIRDTNGNAFDLTNMALRMEVRQGAGGPLVFAMASADGTLINGGTAGTVTMNATAPQSYGVSRFDLWGHDALGNVHPLTAGTFVIIQPITSTLP